MKKLTRNLLSFKNKINVFNFGLKISKISMRNFSTINPPININTFKTFLDQNDYKNAQLLILQSLSSAKESSDLTATKEKLDSMADKLRHEGNHLELIKVLELFANTLSATNLNLEEIYKYILECNLSIAESYDKLNKLDLAEEYVNKNISLLQEMITKNNASNDRISYEAYLALMHFNKGFYKLKQDQKDFQTEFDKLIDLYNSKLKEGLSGIDVVVRKELGTAMQFLKNYKDAIYIYNSFLNSNEITPVHENSFLTYILGYKNIIDCYLHLNFKDEAANYLEKYGNLLEEFIPAKKDTEYFDYYNHYYLEIARVYEGLSQDYLNEGNLTKAEFLANTAEQYYQKYSSEEIYRAATEYIKANIYDAQKKYKECIETSEKYIHIVNEFTEKVFTKEGDYKDENLMHMYDHLILSYREQIFYLILCYHLIASSQYNLNELQKAREFYLLTHNKLNENIEMLIKSNMQYEALIYNLKLKIAIGNKLTASYEESIKDIDYVIQNSNASQINNTLFAWFNKALILFETKEYARSKQNIIDILEFIRQKQLKLTEDKMKALHQLYENNESALKEN